MIKAICVVFILTLMALAVIGRAANAHQSEGTARMLSIDEPNTGTPLSAHTFDFLPGSWTVSMRQRKLNGELQAVGEWTTFPATAEFERVLEGKAIFGKYHMQRPSGPAAAIDTRFFNAETKAWTIYWASGQDSAWQDNPFKGGFATRDAIVFIIDDSVDGHPVQTRYMWHVRSHDHATWEQSFSNDRGKTWVSNWFMEFTRRGS